ncbi:unnamed protein product [Ambrosiozyma monospora]|uniref:Unnamed protein product n=1 Tax=Ambrosiozyma monospora TaxID=43982 RepID=A0ACB5SWY7_AMBMO|nr:unnamed protein product [Ambrosiozyma monospora]
MFSTYKRYTSSAILGTQSLSRAFTRLSLSTYASRSFSSCTAPLLKEEATKTTKKTTKKKKPAKKEKKLSQLQLKRQEKPKHPPSAFALYVRDFTKTASPETRSNIGELSKAASEAWNNEIYANKIKYEAMNKELRDDYKVKMEAWREKYPKRPLNAYQKFLSEYLKNSSLKSKDSAERKDAFKDAVKQWKSLTDDEKAKWKTA